MAPFPARLFSQPAATGLDDAVATRAVRSGRAEVEMELTDLERDFLRRLLGESWISPPLFDHETVARLVELGLVETEPLPSGDIEYRITEAGRAAATA